MLLLGLVVVFLVWTAMTLLGVQRAASRRQLEAHARVQRVTDLAYLHDELSPALAGAIIDRTRGLRADSPAVDLERALDDVLDLARTHRAQEPDLATIVIDTVRTHELP